MNEKGISRRKLLGGAAVAAPAVVGLGGLLASRGATAEAPGAGMRTARGAATATPGHEGFAHATFAEGPRSQPPRQRLRPDRDAARLRLRQDPAPGQRPPAARVDDRRPGQGDRSRARGQVRSLDLQRPRSRADPAGPRGGAAADPLRQLLRPPAHDALPRHPPGADGRHAGDRRKPRRRPDPARRRPSPTSSRRSRSASTSTTATSPRSPPTSPTASTAPSSSTQEGPPRSRRDGDGDERLRHQLRPRQRGLRRQHGRLPLRQPSRSRSSATSWFAIYLVNVLEYDPLNSFHVHANFFQYYPTGTSLEPERVHRHGDPGPGAAGDPRDEVPLRRRLHVPRPRQRVRRARLDRLLPGRRPVAAERRRRRRRLLRAALGRQRERRPDGGRDPGRAGRRRRPADLGAGPLPAGPDRDRDRGAARSSAAGSAIATGRRSRRSRSNARCCGPARSS